MLWQAVKSTRRALWASIQILLILTLVIATVFYIAERSEFTEEKGNDIFLFDFNYHTDYSPGRKEQLSRDLRVSNTEEQIMKLFEDMLAENIKKGWKEVE